MGDYLAEVCGFVHIDGDCCFRSQEPAQKELTANLVKCFYSYWFDEKVAPEELWKPYYQFLFNLVKQVPENRDIVISHSVFRRESREYLLQALGDNAVFILLSCSKDELISRAKVRFAVYAEGQGKSIEQCFSDVNNGAVYSEEKFAEVTINIMRGLQPIEADEQRSFTLNVSSHDQTTFDNLHMLLSLPPAPSIDKIPFEKIAQANYARF